MKKQYIYAILSVLAWSTPALKEAGKNTAAVANLAYLTPFLSLVISAIFLQAPVDYHAIIALVFIVGGILVQSIVAARKSHSRH